MNKIKTELSCLQTIKALKISSSCLLSSRSVLQKEYTKLELTEKLTILLSTLIMILVLTILGMVALFYLLFALAYILEPLVGGLMVSFGIIAGINVLLIAIIYFFRRQLIISPMVNFLANLFLNDSNKK